MDSSTQKNTPKNPKVTKHVKYKIFVVKELKVATTLVTFLELVNHMCRHNWRSRYYIPSEGHPEFIEI